MDKVNLIFKLIMFSKFKSLFSNSKLSNLNNSNLFINEAALNI